MDYREVIESGQAVLGMELGSTRIKAVLTAPDHRPIASGEHAWENRYENGIWTYSMEDIHQGLQAAFTALRTDVQEKYGVELRKLASMGVSAMMHGYLPFDRAGNLLTPFRTWRNTCTGPAAAELTERFQFNIPQRWSIAHLHQAILNEEYHVRDIAFLTTLAGYIHWRLTGRKVLGIGEASGMFPIDSDTLDYDARMLSLYDSFAAGMDFPWKLREILPTVLCAGDSAGTLTAEGAAFLDASGTLEPGVPVCPPEGDAGTGMVATNAVAARTGNVSAGTSVFAMVVLEKPLSKVYPEIDMVTTPTGRPVAMVHCNNCTNEINAWATVFQGFLKALGRENVDMGTIYTAMFRTALEGEQDAGGLLLYNFLSGEPVAGLDTGRPLLVRKPEAVLNFPNFMRSQLYSALAALKMGLDILAGENVAVDRLMGHGGFFKTPEAGQQILAAAAGAPVSVMETAGEGGPWGMALLAEYAIRKKSGQSLESWLADEVFAGSSGTTVEPDRNDVAGFAAFLQAWQQGLAVEKAAGEVLQSRSATAP